ncbi:MAG TPA: lipid-binding SYLF domain-containing protein [Gemmataceae bacterium]|nr:lipid-binding SYLF domain-containing protein [Gemmataceae bacterium]
MKPSRLFLALGILAAWPTLADAAGPPRATIDDAIDVLDDLAGTPEKRIPPALLHDAAAVIIAPDVVKGGFIVAARHGHGVLLVRQKGGWSDPVFVTVTGGGVGWQAGVQATDLFLVIRNGRSLDRILRGAGKLTLGADAAVTAGPIGRDVSAATDAQLKAEILSYSRSRGAFAGISLEGDTLLIDRAANDRFYGARKVGVADILGGKVDPPKGAATLRARLGDWSADKEEALPAPRPAPPPVVDPPKKG